MKLALSALAALAVAATATGAGASAVTVTYQGVISGTDSLGLFGVPGADLNYAPYTAVFTIGSLSGSSTTITGDETLVSGGSFNSTVSPVESFTLTVNGRDYTDDLAFLGTVISVFQSSSYARNEYIVGGLSTDGAQINQDVVGELDNPSIFHSFDFTGPPYSSGGTFYFANGEVSDNLTVQPYSVSVAGEAPEPGAWALMMVGMFGLGGVMRGRRGRQTARAV